MHPPHLSGPLTQPPNTECRCGLPPGMCETLPASMFVDWVRVYQLENDPRHFVGCDHPSHPTRKFIQAHRWRYQRDTEQIPIQKIQRVRVTCVWCWLIGGWLMVRPAGVGSHYSPHTHPRPTGQGYGTCKTQEDCAPGGTCNMRKKACICQTGWTGPYCKQRAYGDDDARGPIRLPVMAPGFNASLTLVLTLLVGLLGLAVFQINGQRGREEGASGRGDGYRAVPRG